MSSQGSGGRTSAPLPAQVPRSEHPAVTLRAPAAEPRQGPWCLLKSPGHGRCHQGNCQQSQSGKELWSSYGISGNSSARCCAPQTQCVAVADDLLTVTTSLTAKHSTMSDRRKQQLPGTNKDAVRGLPQKASTKRKPWRTRGNMRGLEQRCFYSSAGQVV